MRHVDFSPLYRSTVGFDRLFTMLDSLGQPEGGQTTYPPYNIERTGEDAYRISMAVAGFSEDEISIEAHRNVLTVKGERSEENKGEGSELLYRGIASRSFERRFQLGNREIVFPALEAGEIDVVAEYAATLLEFVNEGAGEATTDPEETAELLRDRLEPLGLTALEYAEATDQNGIVVTRETADTYGLATVSDLGKPLPTP